MTHDPTSQRSPGGRTALPPDPELARLRARVSGLERERLARMDAERALRESEARYRELVDQCPDPIVVHRDGVLLFANPAAARMAGGGLRPADLVGRHVLAFVHPQERARAGEALARVSAGEPPTPEVESRVIAPDGRELFVESVERPVVFQGKPAVQVVVRDVTARKRAEAELQAMRRELEARVERRTADLSRALRELGESESRHRALVRATPDLLARIGRDGIVRDLHPGPLYEHLVDGARVRGRPLARILPPDLVEPGRRLIERVCRRGGMRTVQFLTPTPLGPRTLEARVVASGTDEAVVVIRDVTERVEAEDSLRRSEARQRALLRASPDTLVRLSRDGRILDAHPGRDFPAAEGLRRRVGRRLADAGGAGAGEAALAALERVCATGEMETFEHRMLAPTGPRDFEVRLVASGEDEVLAVLREVSEARRAAAALRDSEERFRKIFEDGPLGMALVGPDLRFLRANPALRRMLGRSEADLARCTFLEITHPEDRPRDEAVLRKLIDGEITTFTIEKRYLRPDGEALPVRVTGAVVRDAAGGLAYGIGMFEDIREERRAQAALRRAEERLHHSERLASIGTLAAGIAHEINNPIGAILLAGRWARARVDPGDAELQASLRDVEDHARRCRDVVRNVLRFARQETLERRPCDLNACVERVRELARQVAERRGAAVAFELGPGPLRVSASPTALEQVLLNLIRNAVEAGGAGHAVGVATRAGNGTARVVVRDAGRGMGVEEKTYLFDPFYTTRRADGGTGLGLSISHGIVTDHGGVIHVESEPGRGTAVTVELPSLSGSAAVPTHHERGEETA